jgi:hypothetical protein
VAARRAARVPPRRRHVLREDRRREHRADDPREAAARADERHARAHDVRPDDGYKLEPTPGIVFASSSPSRTTCSRSRGCSKAGD